MRITVNISEDLEKKVRKHAKEKNKSISAFISDILKEKINREERHQLIDSILEISGKAHVLPEADEELRKMRTQNDRF